MTEKKAKEKTIFTQYAELQKFSQNEEYERALKAANKILGLDSHEFLAFHSKIVCLIELSRFEEVITQINKNPEYLQNLIFEKAYSFYRLNKLQDALATINKSEDEVDYRVSELKAQIHYRLEEYKEAHSIYQSIIKNTDDEYEEERLTNLYATMVYLDDNEKVDLDELKESPYELCYNKACMLIAMENYTEAEKKLKQCEKLCREKLEEDEDVAEEDVDIELALIRIQLAFVYQKQGRIKEAQSLYSANLKLKLGDVALQAVASNNVVCINKDQNLFDSKKKMKVALNEALVHKLPSLQRKYIALNNAILNYYINQPDQCEKICKTIESTWSNLLTSVNVIRALNLVKADKIVEAIELLKKEAKNETSELYVDLCITQFHLMKGSKVEACRVLENLGKDTYKPGIVGALTTLYLAIGDEAAALKVFEKSVEFYKKQKMKSGDLSTFWRQAADFHIRNGHPQVAANSLEELLASNKDDKKIRAQLVLACSQFDTQKAFKLSSELPTIEELSKGIDIDNIQTLAPVHFKKSPGVRNDSTPSTPRSDSDGKRKRKHKKRKGKLPKNYDSTVQPDPERWLPKHERIGFKKKRDRRNKEVIKGSQGTSHGQSEQYDFSKKVDETPESPGVEPSPKVSHSKQSQHQKKSNQKKKGKRR
ncbi:signal recognition particle subunit SRP72 [Euwallacea similis]|uniref:signal recognition particle subunit SRP72 n=1 Tax=Euwallacea similis TaxID=1736056 RepID=UPI00344E0DC9